MRQLLSWTAALLVALSVGACSDGLFGSDDEEEEAAVALSSRLEPIQAVRSIEIGRTRDGIVVTALGTAPTLGFGGAKLQPRRDGRPGTDGFLDFDFVATPPDPNFDLPQGTVQARAIRADHPLRELDLNGVAGIRVHSLTNGVQVVFSAPEEGAEPQG